MKLSVLYMTASPNDCDPPHKVARPEQVIDLANSFVENGWDTTKPRLVAYPLNGRIQLLSGSHRWAAAQLADIEIPLAIVSYEVVKDTWGTDEWFQLMKVGDNERNSLH